MSLEMGEKIHVKSQTQHRECSQNRCRFIQMVSILIFILVFLAYLKVPYQVLFYFSTVSMIFLSQLLIFLTASGTRLDILLDDVDNRLCTVYEWLCGNKLTRPRISPKLNILSLYLGKRKNKDLYPPLQIENICLEQSSFIKYLGVYIDCHLAQHDHIDYISSKNFTKRSTHLDAFIILLFIHMLRMAVHTGEIIIMLFQ